MPSVQCEAGLFVVEQNLVPCLRGVTTGASIASHELLEGPFVMIRMTRDALQRLERKDRGSSPLRMAISAQHRPVRSG